jgi:DNA replication ATP-dependent helicase Dna2
VLQKEEENKNNNPILTARRSVVFLNTDEVPAPEIGSKDREAVRNDVEAELVGVLAMAMIHCGLAEDQIGVISPYREQLKVIAHRVSMHPKIEVKTVDSFQGRDKDCVIMSLVRSNNTKTVGQLREER